MPYEQWSSQNALLVLNGVADAIVTIDARGVIVFVNEAVETMFGFDRQELLGRPVDVLMPATTASQHQGYIETFIATGVAHIIGQPREVVAQKKDGSRFSIRLTVNQLQTAGAPQFAGIMHDLTEQNARQVSLHAQREQLARAGRLNTVGEMTASIAHEMNQPLTAIAMYAQACQRLLVQPDVDVGKLSDALSKLSDQALRAGAVNERVQHFVRSEEEPRVALDLNQLLEDIRPLAAGDARAHGIELNYKLAAGLPPATCIGINVQQVTLSLLRNAYDAMAAIGCANGVRVSVATQLVQRAENKVLQVTVTDDGPGISTELADSLFNPFTTTKKRGMGLGLSSCRSLITDEGGALDYDNGHPYGASFCFTLPVITEE